MLSGFGARKAPPSEQSAASTSPEPAGIIPQNRSELTLADIGARLGEDNEKLRNLLIDTEHRIGAIGDAQKAFRGLAEPVKSAIRELEQGRIENARLRSALSELRTGYDGLHDNFSALERRAAELDRDRAGTQEQLAHVQQTARGLQRDKSALTNEIAVARADLEQMQMSLVAAQAERSALATARDEADERHRAEAYTLNVRIEALRARATTAEKLLSEVRQSLVLRTEELRLAERKTAEATIARTTAEKTIEALTTARDALGTNVQKLELRCKSLTERSNSLAETLKARDASLAQAEQKIKVLSDRIAEIDVDAGAYRAKTERRIEELTESLQRERAASHETMVGKVREFEQTRAMLIERSNSLAETLMAREASRADAEGRIRSLTDRLAEIEADAASYRNETERRLAQLNDSLDRERAAGRAALDEKMREFERERASLLEASDTQAGILKAREAEVAQAEHSMKALSDRVAEIDAEAAAYRAKAEARIDELKDGLERERMDRESIHAALNATINGLDQERASLMARCAELAETLKLREIALADGAKEIKSLTDRIAEIQSTARAYRTQSERRIRELNERLERERAERAPDREARPRSTPPPQREITARQAWVATHIASGRTAPAAPRSPNEAQGGQIALFVSRKERKIVVHEGLVPLLTIPVVIEEPDRPLGTHIFTAVGSTEDGSGIGWKLVIDPAALPTALDKEDPVQAGSRATEALNRIRWPNEAADRLIDFLIPGASLVISDDELGPMTRSWCERIKHAGTVRA